MFLKHHIIFPYLDRLGFVNILYTRVGVHLLDVCNKRCNDDLIGQEEEVCLYDDKLHHYLQRHTAAEIALAVKWVESGWYLKYNEA